MLMECIELTWLCKHMEKLARSQAAIFVLKDAHRERLSYKNGWLAASYLCDMFT